jgi:hypothetical protein
LNPRHAAAPLALLSRYPMSPLVDWAHGKVLYNASLQYWIMEHSSDITGEFEAGRESGVQLMMRLARSITTEIWDF